MVHWALQSYLRSLGTRLDHLPRRIQRQVEAEVLAHVQDQARLLRADDGEMDLEGSIHAALESLGAAEGLVVAIGPVGGLVRSGTQEMVLPVRALSKEGLGKGSRRVAPWVGAAAAGFALALAAILFFAFAPEPDQNGLAGTETADAADGLDGDALWSFTGDGFSGEQNGTFDWRGGPLRVVVKGEGCLDATFRSDGQNWFIPSRCGTWQRLLDLPAGTYQIEATFEGFTGSVQVVPDSA